MNHHQKRWNILLWWFNQSKPREPRSTWGLMSWSYQRYILNGYKLRHTLNIWVKSKDSTYPLIERNKRSPKAYFRMIHSSGESSFGLQHYRINHCSEGIISESRVTRKRLPPSYRLLGRRYIRADHYSEAKEDQRPEVLKPKALSLLNDNNE